jgi:hypothetical protein
VKTVQEICGASPGFAGREPCFSPRRKIKKSRAVQTGVLSYCGECAEPRLARWGMAITHSGARWLRLDQNHGSFVFA